MSWRCHIGTKTSIHPTVILGEVPGRIHIQLLKPTIVVSKSLPCTFKHMLIIASKFISELCFSTAPCWTWWGENRRMGCAMADECVIIVRIDREIDWPSSNSWRQSVTAQHWTPASWVGELVSWWVGDDNCVLLIAHSNKAGEERVLRRTAALYKFWWCRLWAKASYWHETIDLRPLW